MCFSFFARSNPTCAQAWVVPSRVRTSYSFSIFIALTLMADDQSHPKSDAGGSLTPADVAVDTAFQVASLEARLKVMSGLLMDLYAAVTDEDIEDVQDDMQDEFESFLAEAHARVRERYGIES